MEQLLKYFPNLTPTQIDQFERMGELYREWNSKINVISRKDIDSLYTHHILHSLAIVRTGKIVAGQSVADVGCGGGFPVIPLAVLMPDVQFTAIDSIGKKIKVVTEISTALGLTNLTPINARIEAVDQDFDWVISRAVTDLKTFVGWTWHKTTYGILYLKGGDLTQEIKDAGRKTTVYDIKKWFADDFFDTKKVLYLPK